MRLRLFAALASAATLFISEEVSALKISASMPQEMLFPGETAEQAIDLVQVGKESDTKSEDHALNKVLKKQERAKELADRKSKPQAVQDHENFLDAQKQQGKAMKHAMHDLSKKD